MPKTSDALAGIAAVVAGVGAGHLAAAFVAPGASPVLAIGSAVVDRVPAGLKEFAIRWFGTADKPVLVAVVALVAVLLGGVAGLAQRRGLGVWVVAALAALCGWAAVTRPSVGSFGALPAVVAGVVGMATLAWLAPRRGIRPSPPQSTGTVTPYADPTHGVSLPVDSGSVARRTAVTAAVGVAGIAAGGLGEARVRTGRDATLPTALPTPADPLPPLPAGLEATTPGLTPFRTPVTDFYRVDTAFAIPRVDSGTWRLTIDGEVDAPYELSLADLLALPAVEADITLNCVSNPVGGDYIGSTRWLGIPVRDVLQRARIRPGADQILSTSVDGMTISTPVGALTDDRGALLAVAMNGAPLPPEHGYPVRMITPGLYGYVGATKWLRRLTATTYAAQHAYWTDRGWSERAEVKTQARIDTPHGSIPAGPTVIAGVAWSQARHGISRVEVRIDDGPWTPAQLGHDAGGHYWRQWRAPWTAASGRHTVTVRATDGLGTVQTSTVADPAPDGASGLHTITVQVT